jgi:hypothetical protein
LAIVLSVLLRLQLLITSLWYLQTFLVAALERGFDDYKKGMDMYISHVNETQISTVVNTQDEDSDLVKNKCEKLH